MYLVGIRAPQRFIKKRGRLGLARIGGTQSMKRILILVSVLALQFSMGGLAIAADGDDSKPGLYLQGAFAGQAKT
ncbi:MAG: hypothetical protein CL917_09020, partial [Deltaproteobacteria bacterium]|nr:hypothetical protein [Deltaproteobacteria bacterium]